MLFRRVKLPVLSSLLVACALIVGACGASNDVNGVASTVGTNPDEIDGYRVTFRGVVNDTLTGGATFGHVFDTGTGVTNAVIELETTQDFAGGIVIATGGQGFATTGRYAFDAEEFARGNSGVTLIYRQGLHRAFRARSGTLTLTAVTDTLIRGSFDAVMVGEVAERGRDPISGEVEVSGVFSATAGEPGYIIGL